VSTALWSTRKKERWPWDGSWRGIAGVNAAVFSSPWMKLTAGSHVSVGVEGETGRGCRCALLGHGRGLTHAEGREGRRGVEWAALAGPARRKRDKEWAELP